MSTELTFDELLDVLSDDQLTDIVSCAIESEVVEVDGVGWQFGCPGSS